MPVGCGEQVGGKAWVGVAEAQRHLAHVLRLANGIAQGGVGCTAVRRHGRAQPAGDGLASVMKKAVSLHRAVQGDRGQGLVPSDWNFGAGRLSRAGRGASLRAGHAPVRGCGLRPGSPAPAGAAGRGPDRRPRKPRGQRRKSFASGCRLGPAARGGVIVVFMRSILGCKGGSARDQTLGLTPILQRSHSSALQQADGAAGGPAERSRIPDRTPQSPAPRAEPESIDAAQRPAAVERTACP